MKIYALLQLPFTISREATPPPAFRQSSPFASFVFDFDFMAFTRAFGQRKRGKPERNLCNSLPWELKSHLRNTTAQKLNFLPHSGQSGSPEATPSVTRNICRRSLTAKGEWCKWGGRNYGWLDKLQFRSNTCELLKFYQELRQLWPRQ